MRSSSTASSKLYLKSGSVSKTDSEKSVHTRAECVTCRLKAFFILGVGSLRAAAAAGGAATLLGSFSAGGVI